MAKKKQKKKSKSKKQNQTEATETRIGAVESEAGMSATALASFARDLAAFGSRAGSHASRPAG